MSPRRRRRRSAPRAPSTPPVVQEGRGPDPADPGDDERRRRRLSAKVALALTYIHLPAPHRLGDCRLFTGGRFNLWPEYGDLPEAEKVRICRFRVLCAPGLEHDRIFMGECLRQVDRGGLYDGDRGGILPAEDDFEPDGSSPDLPSREMLDGQGSKDGPRRDWLDEIRFVPNLRRDITEALDEWMQALEASRSHGQVKKAAPGRRESRILHTWNADFVIPNQELGDEGEPWPELGTTPFQPISLKPKRLYELAAALDRVHAQEAADRGLPQPAAYRETTLRDSLFGPMLSGEDKQPLREDEPLTPGELSLLISPTGSGKSVLTTVLALEMAGLGIPIAIAVPRVSDVWQGTFRLEKDIELLRKHAPEVCPRPIQVAALSSSARRFEQLVRHLSDPPPWDPGGKRVLERFGYVCALRAFLETKDDEPALRRGEEPCHSLAYSRGPKAVRHACPFLRGCGLHREEGRFLEADVTFVNHHALLMGVHKLPTLRPEPDGRPRRRPFIETLLTRCGLILLDEVDQLQKVMVDQDSGDLPLASRQRVSPIHRLFSDLEHHAARAERPLTPHQDRTRRDLMTIQAAAQELTHLLEPEGGVSWARPPQIRFSGSDEAWLRECVLGERGAPLMNPRLKESELSEESTLRDLGEALLSWVNIRVDDGLTPSQRLAALHHALQAFLGAHPKSGLKVQVEAARDGFILRALLLRLEETLTRLSVVLPELLSLKIASAEAVQNALGAPRHASVSPLGPLGRPVFGFSWMDRENQASPLMSLALRGDPHGDLSRLGSDLARGLVGHTRCVVGLSATAWLPGSSLCHVRGGLRFYRPDPDTRVTVFKGLSDIRISGVSDKDQRLKACEALTEQLWPQLKAERALLQGAGDFEGQDKLLLVTGSYKESHRVAQTLALLMGKEDLGTPWCVQPKLENGQRYHAIPHRDIETFGPDEKSWVLVAPLTVISRGHNILQGRRAGAKGGSRSALGAIYLLVRPIPPLGDASRLLAHITNLPIKVSFEQPMHGRIEEERRESRKRFQRFMTRVGPLSHLPPDLRRAVICDVLAEVSQLVGRARRGNTGVRVHLADGAFGDEKGDWALYLREALSMWEDSDDPKAIFRIHFAFLRGMATAFDIDLESLH